jgi:hypothetical protein
MSTDRIRDETQPAQEVSRPKGPAPGPDCICPRIPDQNLLRCIGRGSYGEVWLSRSVTGLYRAVKVVYRSRFDHDQPFEREFSGLKYFEKVCLTHPSLVALLQVGMNGEEGYFYYVMEVADDVAAGQTIAPENYRAMTLRSLILHRGRLPLVQCLEIGTKLADALKHLQQHGLIHRDVKPSNIIFVNGVPKFADIGLVTAMNEPASWVGTDHYMPPEGPGGPTSDLYSLGRVLYEISTGLTQDRFPELPTDLLEGSEEALTLRLNRIVLKACAHNARERYQSAAEMHADLLRCQTGPLSPTLDTSGRVVEPAGILRIAILAKPGAQPDTELLAFLQAQLEQQGCRLFLGQPRGTGVTWVRQIEEEIERSDVVVVLLSAESVLSEMLAYEAEAAQEAAKKQQGLPRLVPIGVRFPGPLPEPLARILGSRPLLPWDGPQDNGRLLEDLNRLLRSPEAAELVEEPTWEATGGAVPLDSRFYIERTTDEEFKRAIARKDSIVLVKGARQIGKTSLLARGLQHARQSGAKVVLTDFQKLDATHLASVETLYLKLADFLADQLDLEKLPGEVWDERRSPNTNFERYLRREVLGKVAGHLVWGMDEVDRLFGRDFASEVFGLLRSWHNERALDPSGPWWRLTLVIAYATEAHLFISDINQSPFNVGTRLRLEDFTLDQIADLNERHSRPLKTAGEVQELFVLLGGQPYLVRQALNELASGKVQFAGFVEKSDRDEGIFGDHLRRILVLLAKDADLCEMVRAILRDQPCRDATSFYRLRSAGVMKGDSPDCATPRCKIYESYLKRHLL